MSTQVKANEVVYIANKKLKYNGKVHERGEIVELIGGPWDVSLEAQGQVHPVDRAIYERQQGEVKEDAPEDPPADFEVSDILIRKLDEAGYSLEEAFDLSDELILELPGVGPASLAQIREAQIYE